MISRLPFGRSGLMRVRPRSDADPLAGRLPPAGAATLPAATEAAEGRFRRGEAPISPSEATLRLPAGRPFGRWLLLGELAAFVAIALPIWLFAQAGIDARWTPSFEVALLCAVGAVASFTLAGLYGPSVIDSLTPDEPRRVADALVRLALAGLALDLIVLPGTVTSWETAAILSWLGILFVTSLLTRSLLRREARRRRPERVLVVGAGRTGQAVARRLRAGGRGITVAAFVDDDPLPRDRDLADVPVYPESGDLAQVVAASGATRLVLAFSRTSSTDLLDRLRHSRCGPIPVAVVPRLHELTPPRAVVSEIQGIPLVNLSSGQLSSGARLAKRIIDVSVASVGIIVLLPAFFALALAIRVDSRGPVLFRQRRIGRRGKEFSILKFRTMVDGAERDRHAIDHLNDMKDGGPLFKMRRDPRVTRVGRVLRRTSLDELPQLVNVLTGSMSLVGPRPFVTHEAEQIQGWRARRLDIAPGITGLWQISGRNDVPYDEMIRLDCLYVANWSVWWDLRIIGRTLPCILSRRGAELR